MLISAFHSRDHRPCLNLIPRGTNTAAVFFFFGGGGGAGHKYSRYDALCKTTKARKARIDLLSDNYEWTNRDIKCT